MTTAPPTPGGRPVALLLLTLSVLALPCSARAHAYPDHADPKLLEVDVPQLKPGTYRVTWSVVAKDGHRTSGDYTFTMR